MTRLSVNINKIATIRNARGGNMPDVEKAAVDCERFGAQGITVHPRPDERHIRYSDVRAIRPTVKTEFNIEGNPIPSFIDLVMEVVPDQVAPAAPVDDAQVAYEFVILIGKEAPFGSDLAEKGNAFHRFFHRGGKLASGEYYFGSCVKIDPFLFRGGSDDRREVVKERSQGPLVFTEEKNTGRSARADLRNSVFHPAAEHGGEAADCVIDLRRVHGGRIHRGHTDQAAGLSPGKGEA